MTKMPAFKKAQPLTLRFSRRRAMSQRIVAKDPVKVESFAKALEAEKGVDGVRYDLALFRRIRTLLGVLAWAGAGLGAILMGASVSFTTAIALPSPLGGIATAIVRPLQLYS